MQGRAAPTPAWHDFDFFRQLTQMALHSQTQLGFHTFASGKQYTYIKPKEAPGPIFLRNIVFLTPANNSKTIAIVCEMGSHGGRATWEPPKGQMEWKEFADSGFKSGQNIAPAMLFKYMRRGALREMTEEAKLLPSEIQGLQPLPIQYKQEWKESKIAGAAFMYQFWHAIVKPGAMSEAQKRLKTLVSNPDWINILPADICEKQAIKWWNPTRDDPKLIRGSFSNKMTKMYYAFLESKLSK